MNNNTSNNHKHDRESEAGFGRRLFVQGCGAMLAFAAAGTSIETVRAQENAGDTTRMQSVLASNQTQSGDIAELLDDLPTNWGRWGDDDELGALNLIDSEQMFAGMQASMKGGKNQIERFTLQLSVTGDVINPDPAQPDVVFPPEDGSSPTFPSTDTGDPAFPPRTPARRDNTTPTGGTEVTGGIKYVDDKFVTDVFLQGTTHLDALGHPWYGGKLYNGFPASTTEATKEFETPLLGTTGTDAVPDSNEEPLESVSETRGLEKAAVSKPASKGVSGRGVLLDVGRQFGGESGRLDLEECVTFDDLMTTADAQDTEIEERDILLIRTGAIARTRDSNAEWGPLIEPGLRFSEELVEWIHDMDIPYIGADNLAVEKVSQEIDGETFFIPLHGALTRNLGVYLNEILWLEDLGAACAEDGIYDFLFTAAPLNVERASGAPINPIVLKASKSAEDEGGDGGVDT